MSHRYRYYKCFWRFQNIAVPQGATVDSAYLRLPWGNGPERTFKVVALASGNAPQPTDKTLADHGLETTASGTWTIPYHGAGIAVAHTSPNINNVIQEVVDRGDWSTGNSMLLMVRIGDEAANSISDKKRTMYFSESTEPEADEEAQLTITYS